MAIWLIKCLDETETGKTSWWIGGDRNEWVEDRESATRYTRKQKEAKERDQMPDRGAWVAIPMTWDNFRSEYEVTLRRAVARDLGGYDITLDGVPQRVRERMAALRDGEGTIGEALKAVAKGFGIPATQGGIQKFLNSADFQ
jgi:hypothetical protein